MAEPNAEVRTVLESLVEQGPEIGLQVAAYLDGKLVIDVWAGLADHAAQKPVEGDTLFMLSTAVKGITATCMHTLADMGKIDYDDPIVKYWPEFGANGKEKTTIRDVLNHRTGIPQTPKFYTPEWLPDWDKMCQGIAKLRPMFEPGLRTTYASVNYGFINGEILRRADGRTIHQFLQQEIAGPLGADIHLGVPDASLARVATLTDGPPESDELNARLVGADSDTEIARYYNQKEMQQAMLPGVCGIMSARGLARHYAMLANWGELDGVRILSPERVHTAIELQSFERDEIYWHRAKRALGYRLGPACGPGATDHAFGHVGRGGSFGYADPSRNFALAISKNYFSFAFLPGLGPDARTPAQVISQAVHKALGLAYK